MGLCGYLSLETRVSFLLRGHRHIHLGSRDGVVVRALASRVRFSDPASRGLSLLVLFPAPRGFSPGTPVFPSTHKPTFISPIRPHKLPALNCIPCINKVSLPLPFTSSPLNVNWTFRGGGGGEGVKQINFWTLVWDIFDEKQSEPFNKVNVMLRMANVALFSRFLFSLLNIEVGSKNINSKKQT